MREGGREREEGGKECGSEREMKGGREGEREMKGVE